MPESAEFGTCAICGKTITGESRKRFVSQDGGWVHERCLRDLVLRATQKRAPSPANVLERLHAVNRQIEQAIEAIGAMGDEIVEKLAARRGRGKD